MADRRNLKAVNIRWHLGFYGAAEIEFLANKGDLDFTREYNLGKEPLRVDLLVVRKLADSPIENEIGHIFKRHNIIEYKSPEDELSIDDFYKTVGYACLYKGLGQKVDQIPLKELSISIFREVYPQKLFQILGSLGMKIENPYPGIYYLRGWQAMPDTQIVVTGELDGKHRALRVLSKNAMEEDVRGFIEEASRLTEPGDRNNADAVMQASVSANRVLYEKIRRCNPAMCEALRELMKDEIEREIEEQKRQAALQAEQKAKKESTIELIKNLMDSMKWTAEQAMEAMKVPVKDREQYMAGL